MAAIRAVLTGGERIEKPLLEAIELDHAAIEEAAAPARDQAEKPAAEETMSDPMSPARRVPVVPRPREGELSGSYLGRLARANRTELRTFVRLLSQLPVQLPADQQDLAVMLLTLNDAAFARLLTYTGHLADRLTRAIPSLTPRTFKAPGEPPAIRISFLHESTIDCPGCRRRRGGAYLDTRLFPHKMACLRHGYWLYGQGRGQPLDFTLIPEVAAAQRRFDRLVSRRGSPTAARAYRIADSYLNSSWRVHYHPWWYPAMVARWQQRAGSGDSPPASSIWQFPGWAMHPECAALATVFASQYWAQISGEGCASGVKCRAGGRGGR